MNYRNALLTLATVTASAIEGQPAVAQPKPEAAPPAPAKVVLTLEQAKQKVLKVLGVAKEGRQNDGSFVKCGTLDPRRQGGIPCGVFSAKGEITDDTLKGIAGDVCLQVAQEIAKVCREGRSEKECEVGVLTPTYNKEGTNEDRVMVMDFRYSIGGKDTSPNGLEFKLICDTSAETYGNPSGVVACTQVE